MGIEEHAQKTVDDYAERAAEQKRKAEEAAAKKNEGK